MFRELPSAPRVRHPELRPQLIHWSLNYQGLECSNLQGVLLLAQVRMWHDLQYTVFDTRTLGGFKGAVKRWLIPVAPMLVGLRKQLINNFVFLTWACVTGFNNNNNSTTVNNT